MITYLFLDYFYMILNNAQCKKIGLTRIRVKSTIYGITV